MEMKFVIGILLILQVITFFRISRIRENIKIIEAYFSIIIDKKLNNSQDNKDLDMTPDELLRLKEYIKTKG